MLQGYYAGLSSLYYNEEKLATTANNLANVNTTGFRRALLLQRTRQESDDTKKIDSRVKERLPDIYGMERASTIKDFSKTGPLQETANPFDIAIPGNLKNAFFGVQGPDGETVYTRNGQLSLAKQDPNNANSPTVLHLSDHIALGEDGQPIPIRPEFGPLEIAGDGTLKQNGSRVGQLPVFRLMDAEDPNNQKAANLQALMPLGDSLFGVPPQVKDKLNALKIEVGQAGVKQTVLQGVKEASNVNIYQELTEMMNATKAADANKNALRIQMDGLSKLFQMLRS